MNNNPKQNQQVNMSQGATQGVNNTVPVSGVAPKFQASPTGGMVATLQPGQVGFDDQIKAESGRLNNFVEREKMMESKAAKNKGVILQKAEVVSGGSSASAQVQEEADPGGVVQSSMPNSASLLKPSSSQTKVVGDQEAVGQPKSILNYKVGVVKKKSSNKRILWIILVGLLILAGIGAVVFYFYYQNRIEELNRQALEVQPEVITLDYWGLWEPTEVLEEVLREYEMANPGVNINYMKQDINGYRARLENAILSNNGPDIFRYHASWRPFLNEELAALPSQVMTAQDYQESFYPVISEQMTDLQGEIKGMPLMYDSLALLYNQDMYAAAGLTLPESWGQFSVNARALTEYDAAGNIIQAGAAMGLGENVDFVTDIVGMLASQSGMDWEEMEINYDGSVEIMSEVLAFYTGYYNEGEGGVWDETMTNSVEAFAHGEVAMIFAPSWVIYDVMKLNSEINIGVASVPQLNLDSPVEWATYWVEGVNADSTRSEEAWELLAYLSSPEVLEKLNYAAKEIRPYGEIYPRVEMASLLISDPYAGPYLENAMTAVGFAYNDKTFDEAVNAVNKMELIDRINYLTLENKQNSDRIEGAAEQLVRSTITDSSEYGYYFISDEDVEAVLEAELNGAGNMTQ